MTITIDLPPAVEASVKAQAAQDGLPLETYISTLVQAASAQRERTKRLAEQPFAAILAPFRSDVEASEMTDDELDTLFRAARKQASRARKESAQE